MPENETNITETVQQVLRVVVEGRWWILSATCGVVLATNALLSLLPNHYNSEATVLVVQQQIPERYVTPTNSTGIADALQAMTQEVLSRTRLQGIIDEFHLYAKERKRRAPEEVIDLMRSKIEILPLNARPEKRDFNAFKISFTADNAYLAQKVASRLTALFIEENLRTREDQAKNTTSFLTAQLHEVEEKLSEQEQRVRDYKMQHLGELPEQQAGNLAILAGMQTQLQNTVASLSRAQQQRVYLESLLNGYRSLASKGVAVPGATGVTSRTLSPLQAAQNELATLQANRESLIEHYTPQHPDVLRIDREIGKKKAQLEALRNVKAPVDGDTKAPVTASVASGDQDDTSIAQLRSQLEANRLEIDSLTKDEKRLKASVAEYQARLNSTPVREQQMSEVLRDYDLLKKNYADLLSKQQQSQLAANLEKQQEGQQFRLVDPPSLPAIPSGPKRLKMSLGGLAGGLLLGVALAFLMDMKFASFHTEKEIKNRFGQLLVIGIPVLSTPAEESKRRWQHSFEWAGGSVLVLMVLVAELYVYRLGG